MLRRTLNLGILAHVDAGKTTLTERLLYAAGVIDAIGRVDDGTTQTDSLALEQQRGITIKSAVASFPIDDLTVNLIDTPGHPDFIAEVERVLSVLDGVVLVVSAVEGVQSQTRVLMRALQRLQIPTLMFVNKVDRRGADSGRVLGEIGDRLTPSVIAMGSVSREGTRSAVYTSHVVGDAAFTSRLVDVLAEHDDAVLAAYVDDETRVSPRQLREQLAAQTQQALVHPVFFGSAITGAGVDELTAAVTELLPAAAGDADGPVSASVFKVERGAGGEKVAYARLFSGTIRVRDRLWFRREGLADDEEAKVTAVSLFDGGSTVRSASVAAGQIGKLWGLGAIQIGDTIGEPGPRGPARRSFAPPTLESIVVPRRVNDKAALYVALTQLAEQDPLIDVRRNDDRQEISVSLYGEVQKEVVQATLVNDFGVDVEFRETTPIYVERPIGTGEAVEILHAESNPYLATIGLRVEPAPDGSGIEFRLQVDHRTVPLYVYKKLENFAEAMGQYVREALQEGLFGWQVVDSIVTMTESNYSSPDGPPATRGPLSTAADFRKLTPLVLVQALELAGTVVCEPTVRVSLEIPTDTIGAVMPALSRLGGSVETPSLQRRLATINAVLPAARADDLLRQLPGLTGGEGALDSSFAGYQPVTGEQPTRWRTTANAVNPVSDPRGV
ncbi:MAG: TetM/TetW/TetO/TetS family tetracycline resistance ribosomal protection protein [Actinobacteria bacterium]|nr:MAG: TetM/TetW/TetO/TetS family tetracycline resistance ribosomal protection protein [Actinomycetota bacterium]